MRNSSKDSISLDLIGISGGYQGGATIFAYTLLSEFVKDEHHKYHVILPENERELYAELNSITRKNVTFHYFKSNDNILFRLMYRIATRIFKNHHLLAQVQRYRWKEAIEFIQNYSSSCLTMSAYISFPLKGVRHYCTLHDIQEKALPQFFSRKERSIRNIQVLNTLTNVTGIQVSSEFVRDEIIRYYPGESRNIDFKVIPEGYSLSELESVGILKDKRARPIRIIFPANYWPHKDHLTFLRAIASISDIFELEIFCTGSTFNKKKEIMQLLEELKVNNVEFTGYLTREELIKLYQSSHIVISCSMYESSSLPILEGSVLGCIPIASDIGPHREMAERLTINLFECGNAWDLKRVLSEVINGTEQQKDAIAIYNSKSVKELSWQALVYKYLEFLDNDLIARTAR